MRTITVPRYRLEALRRQLARVAANAACDPADTRTANALRLARESLRWLDRALDDKEDGKPV